ncbi:MAG: response regulator transcription factor [Phycisphaerae bacterium]|nr:response regulator transcription factor [Phycisphaerae bacterium]
MDHSHSSTSNNHSNPQAARILLVEDHPIVRRGLADIINAEPDLHVCGEADDAPDAVHLAGQCHPDLVIVDISLKRGNGIDLLKQIRARDGHIKLLVASIYDESMYAERALRAGAMGYINKCESTPVILSAIRQVLRGRIYLSTPMVNRMLQSPNAPDPADESPISELSDRELQVFELISRGLTTREIASKLLLSIKTIETHRDHIRMKLKLKNSTELIHHAVQWFLESNASLKMGTRSDEVAHDHESNVEPLPVPISTPISTSTSPPMPTPIPTTTSIPIQSPMPSPHHVGVT